MKKLTFVLVLVAVAAFPAALSACDVCDAGSCNYYYFDGNPSCVEIVVYGGFPGCELQGSCSEYGPPIPGQGPGGIRHQIVQNRQTAPTLQLRFASAVGTACRPSESARWLAESSRKLLFTPLTGEESSETTGG